jgi:hypothetical protein
MMIIMSVMFNTNAPEGECRLIEVSINPNFSGCPARTNHCGSL